MKALFAHDHRFYLKNNEYYSDGGFNDETWSRYLNVFDELKIIARVIENEKVEGLHKLETRNLSIYNTAQINFIDDKMKKLVYECDIVIARLHSFIGNRAIKYAIKLNKPYLIELVACPWEAYWSHGLSGKIVAPYMEIKTRKLVKEAKYVVYVTEKYLQKRYPTKGCSTNCSNVALSSFDDYVLEKRIERINRFDINNNIIIGTTAAVNVKYKGQQFIIKALGRLKKQGITNIYYQLVGGGNQSYLKSIAEKYNVKEQVKFLGALPHHKVFEWLDKIDIYVQPSRQEGLPRALIEAMSRGVPAFGAHTAGIPELLEKEFIFSNTSRNKVEICDILKKFNTETMLNQSKRNYSESKKYDKSIIENRRKNFFLDFANNVVGNNEIYKGIF